MKLTPIGIEGAWFVESPVWSDDRGFFREWFKSEDVKVATGRDFGVEQANISLSSAGTLRGIHYSIAPRGQAKWITCVSGSIQDVIVDIRPDSKTFGQWVEVELKGDSGKAVLISEGLGHGFLALEDKTAVAYLVSTPFSRTDEYEINPLDKKIGIEWRMDLSSLKISEKDKIAPDLVELLNEGKLPT
ncbi:RfbC dTDP-4-dehydrorhamnose 3,5-epimerase and related enzymes [Candidatus Nanopelagicaceae bacterium]